MPLYNINKGIGKEAQFKGFEGVYIYYLAAVVLFSFIAFVILYMCGVRPFTAGFVVAAITILCLTYLYRINKKFGLHGVAQKLAKKRRTKLIRASVKCFREINHNMKDADR